METFFNGLRLSFSSHIFFSSHSVKCSKNFSLYGRHTYQPSHKLHVVVDGEGKRGKLSSWKNRKALTRQLYFVYFESNYENYLIKATRRSGLRCFSRVQFQLFNNFSTTSSSFAGHNNIFISNKLFNGSMRALCGH